MLTINNLYKYFNTCDAPILNNINLKISKGQFCVLVGNNGSGKSTLLKCLSGDHVLDTGEIKLNHQSLTTTLRKKYVASVTQDINKGTIGELTLLENMVLGLVKGKSAKLNFYHHHDEYIHSLIKEVDANLIPYVNKPLNILSGGQRQIIATLMAIVSKPKILLLDEHTSALDPAIHKKLMEFTVRYIIENKITTLMVTHHLGDALTYGNRLIILQQGKIISDFNEEQKRETNIEELLFLFEQRDRNTLLKEVC